MARNQVCSGKVRKNFQAIIRKYKNKGLNLLLHRLIRARLRWKKYTESFKKYQVPLLIPFKHYRLIWKYQGISRIRVLFLVSNLASWKVSPVFEAMLSDPLFEPLVAICPIINEVLAPERHQVAAILRRFFNEKKYPFIDLSDREPQSGKEIVRDFDPHIAFFTNPHGLSHSYLHRELYLTKLSCYVPYHHEVMSYGMNQEQYNQESHNAFWRIYAPHATSLMMYKNTRHRRGQGVLVTGFPACEELVGEGCLQSSAWKRSCKPKKRIIYAPHWLSTNDIKMATIDDFGILMKRYAHYFKEEVQWAFKPHPMLKQALYNNPSWGVQKTDQFYEFWENSSFSQLHEGDYIGLFKESDAIIHDSGSFLAEYLYLQKPAMYLVSKETNCLYFNEFGRRALSGCHIGRNAKDIEDFIGSVIGGLADVKSSSFYNDELSGIIAKRPSLKILESIKSQLNPKPNTFGA